MKRAPERQMHSGNEGGFRFPLLAALWGLVLFLVSISTPAMATTFSFASGNGSDTISSASAASWTENGETLRFAVSGTSDHFPDACDGLLGVAGDEICLGVSGWAVMRGDIGSATISATVSITGKVFDLTSLALIDGITSSVGSYSITTSKGGIQSGPVNVGNSWTILNFSGAQFLGISSFTIEFTGGGGASTAFGLSDLVLNNITSVSMPSVSGISPANGLAADGASVVITGSNFGTVQKAGGVKFGSSNATSYTVDSDTQITAIAPAGSGTQYITVSNAAGTSATGAASQFTYITVPTVSDLSPASGPLAGGNTVVITGTGLTAATAVKFGANNATGVVVNSATQITATAPAGTAGNVFVTVTTPSGTSATGASTRYTYAQAPTAVTGSASAVTATTATLAGNANDNAAEATLSFEYGLSTSYGSTATATPVTLSAGAGSTAVSGSLSGLACNTIYHFRLKAENAVGTTYGSDASFTSAACAPTATTQPADTLGAKVGTLHANINDNGASTSVSFDWGLTTSYGNNASSSPATLAAGAGSTAVSASLSGLNCNTTYHYRVRATNSVGTTLGSDTGFTTTACVPGAPTGVTATAGNMSASVAFTAPTDNGGTAITSYTVTASPGGATGSGSVSPITVTGLTNGTAYTFTVTATNSTGVGPASGASNSVTPINAPPVAMQSAPR